MAHKNCTLSYASAVLTRNFFHGQEEESSSEQEEDFKKMNDEMYKRPDVRNYNQTTYAMELLKDILKENEAQNERISCLMELESDTKRGMYLMECEIAQLLEEVSFFKSKYNKMKKRKNKYKAEQLKLFNELEEIKKAKTGKRRKASSAYQVITENNSLALSPSHQRCVTSPVSINSHLHVSTPVVVVPPFTSPEIFPPNGEEKEENLSAFSFSQLSNLKSAKHHRGKAVRESSEMHKSVQNLSNVPEDVNSRDSQTKSLSPSPRASPTWQNLHQTTLRIIIHVACKRPPFEVAVQSSSSVQRLKQHLSEMLNVDTKQLILTHSPFLSSIFFDIFEDDSQTWEYYKVQNFDTIKVELKNQHSPASHCHERNVSRTADICPPELPKQFTIST